MQTVCYVVQGNEGQSGAMNKPRGKQVSVKGAVLSVKEKKKRRMKRSEKIGYS